MDRLWQKRSHREQEIIFVSRTMSKNGLATREFNEKVLKGQEVQDSLSGADVILITMGSNDLLNEFKKTAQEILNTDTN